MLSFGSLPPFAYGKIAQEILAMAYALRYQKPEDIYLISSRCFNDEDLLQPGEQCNEIILGCLARSSKRHEIVLYGYLFLSNCYYILCGAPRLNVNAFMQDFLSPLARRMNAIQGRSGTFFAERYTKITLLEGTTSFEALIEILSAANALNLVEDLREYVGVSSLVGHLGGESQSARWVDVARYNKNIRRNPDFELARCVTNYEIKITTLPHLQDLSKACLAEMIEMALTERCAMYRASHDGNQSKLGVGCGPDGVKKSRRVICAATCPKLVAKFRESRSRAVLSYKKERKRDCRPVRVKALVLRYPSGMLPPGCRRSVPFESDSEMSGV